MVYTLFDNCVDNSFAFVFTDTKLSWKWWWKIYKLQQRGTVYIQGCFCLDCDTDIKSAEIILKAHMEEFCINTYEDWESTTGEIFSFAEDSIYSDEWIVNKELKKTRERNHSEMDAQLATDYVFTSEDVIKQKHLLINFKIV